MPTAAVINPHDASHAGFLVEMTEQSQTEHDAETLTDGIVSKVCRPEVGDRVTITYPSDRFSANMAGHRIGVVHAEVKQDNTVIGVDVAVEPDGWFTRVIFSEYERDGAEMREWTIKDGRKFARAKKVKPKKVKSKGGAIRVKPID